MRIQSEDVNVSDCLRAMLTLWLKQDYNVDRFGEPSVEMLKEAVRHRLGGNNPALADRISIQPRPQHV